MYEDFIVYAVLLKLYWTNILCSLLALCQHDCGWGKL